MAQTKPKAKPLGIAVNPASGKDIRRLVARASVFDNQEKRAIVRRALVGAVEAGVREVCYVPDSHNIAQTALEEFEDKLHAEAVDSPQTKSVIDTVAGARALAERDCGAVLTLGGDGTNRAFCIGWQDAPLLPISTGTNNVFPVLVEATLAGAAAGLVASGRVALTEAARRAKAITVKVEGERDDFCLIDAVVTRERFVGSRALLDGDMLEAALLTRADPAAAGMTSIGGLIKPVSEDDDHGLYLELDPEADGVNAPIAPGLYQVIGVAAHRRIAFGKAITVTGPCVLAFDGERERALKPGQKATLRIARDGPWVIDVTRAMKLAAERGLFKIKRARKARRQTN